CSTIGCKCDVKVFYFKYFFHVATYFLSFGSRASCNPSPNTLNANIVHEMKYAGKNNVHQFPDKIAPNESFAITHQLACGAWSPSPITLRIASANIADGTVTVICTIIGPMEFGSKSFLMIRRVRAP